MSLKETVYYFYKQQLQDKINHVQFLLQELSKSAANETKSTAGDKHETALAMLQLEQENKRKQLNELQLQQQQFEKIDPTIVSPYILNGSLVKTDQGYFFVSVALGKMMLEDKTIFALSPLSPLGKIMMGHKSTDIIELNGKVYSIITVE
jgi:hypothetical protein